MGSSVQAEDRSQEFKPSFAMSFCVTLDKPFPFYSKAFFPQDLSTKCSILHCLVQYLHIANVRSGLERKYMWLTLARSVTQSGLNPYFSNLPFRGTFIQPPHSSLYISFCISWGKLPLPPPVPRKNSVSLPSVLAVSYWFMPDWGLGGSIPSLTELIMFIRKGEEKGTRRSGYLLGFNQIEEWGNPSPRGGGVGELRFLAQSPVMGWALSKVLTSSLAPSSWEEQGEDHSGF